MREETRTVMVEPERLRVRGVNFRLPGVAPISLERRTITIGSGPDAQVVLDDPTVSRAHARIEADGKGHRFVDLQSKNGSSINGVLVKEAYLPESGMLKLGQVEVEFSLADTAIEVALSRNKMLGELVGESPEMREIFATLERAASANITVLLEGESGTGKELAARALHEKSDRRDGPLVIFDCSAVPAELLESELFGHEEGAFTGATGERVGAFEEAQNGTLFLDEIGELALDLQPKLLRALDAGEFKRVGSSERRMSNARVVAATNRDLSQEVDEGNFRKDLFFRLAVVRVVLPPLRERASDIPVLVRHFLAQMGERGKKVQIPYETMQKLQTHRWMGNVRELKNAVERAVVLSEGSRVETRYLKSETETGMTSPGASADFRFDLPFKDAKNRLLSTFERSYWERILEKTEGNISQAARDGGIHRKSLEYLIRKLGLEVPRG